MMEEAGMRKKVASMLRQAPFAVQLLDLPGEEIPLDNNSVDTVLLTFTLCTIPDWHKALEQMRRVLKPGGCNLNRPIPELIEKAGFNIQNIESQYRPGPKFANYFYQGIAK